MKNSLCNLVDNLVDVEKSVFPKCYNGQKPPQNINLLCINVKQFLEVSKNIYLRLKKKCVFKNNDIEKRKLYRFVMSFQCQTVMIIAIHDIIDIFNCLPGTT